MPDKKQYAGVTEPSVRHALDLIERTQMDREELRIVRDHISAMMKATPTMFQRQYGRQRPR